MANNETEQVLRITVKDTETAGVEIIPTEDGVEIVLTKRKRPEKERNGYTDVKAPTIGGKSNADRLIEFCRSKKEEDGVDRKELRKFYEWYEKRMEDWKGLVKPEVLWKRWMDTK